MAITAAAVAVRQDCSTESPLNQQERTMSHKVLTDDEIDLVAGGSDLSPAQSAQQLAQTIVNILSALTPQRRAMAEHVLRP
jgi:hypothetical protein